MEEGHQVNQGGVSRLKVVEVCKCEIASQVSSLILPRPIGQAQLVDC